MIAPERIEGPPAEQQEGAPEDGAEVVGQVWPEVRRPGIVVAQNCNPAWVLSGPCGIRPVSMQP